MSNPNPHANFTIETTQTLDIILHQILNHALVVVNATGGSLMVVDNNQGILQIKARLGAPRPGRKNEVVYKTDEDSIAAWVVRSKKPYNCPNVEKDPHFAPSRSGKNFSSLLAVPIIYGDEVLAIINADSPKENFFTQNDLEQMESIATRVAEPIATRISILDAMGQVGVELSRLPRVGDVERVLQKIADLAVRSLGADIVTLYPYIQSQDKFPVEGTGPIIAGDINDNGPMRRQVYQGDVPWTVLKERKPGFYSDVHTLDFLTCDVDRPGESPRKRFVDREKIESMAALLLPLRATEDSTEEVVGIMFANYRTRHMFNIDEISALSSFADYAATAILNARYEEERRREQLKMAELLSASLAHRMSHLAGPSRVSAQLIKDRNPSLDEVSIRALDRIESQIDLLFEISERLVHPYMETGALYRVTEIDLEKILKGIVDKLKEHDGSIINVHIDLSDDLPMVKSAEFLLRQVLHDVIENAIESMRDKPESNIHIKGSCNPDKKHICLEITDEGRGVPEKVCNRLFAPGVSTKEGRLGIGLWWCKTFMMATDGDITLKNTSNKGTTFVIEIPVVTNETKRLSVSHSSSDMNDVLIVEDDPEWRSTLLDAIVGQGYSIKIANSFAHARVLLRTEQFKAAVVDIRLEDEDQENIDGLRVVKVIEDTGIQTKIILITGWETNQGKHVAENSPSVVELIEKRTFKLDYFCRLIRRIIHDER